MDQILTYEQWNQILEESIGEFLNNFPNYGLKSRGNKGEAACD